MGSTLGGPFNYQSDHVCCSKCGGSGTVIWAGGQFIKITGDFYERISKKPPYPIELVCGHCGTVQRDNSEPPQYGPPPPPRPSTGDTP